MSNPHPDATPQRAWPAALAVLAPLTSIFAPGLTARRLSDAPLLLCYLAHLIGAFIATVLVFLLIAWGGSELDSGLAGIGQELLELWVNMREEVDRDPRIIIAYLMAFAAIVGVAEGGSVLVGWSMMAWSAGSEPWIQSFRRSLCRAWLITGHAVFYLLAFIVPVIWFERVQEAYWDSYDWDTPSGASHPAWYELSEYVPIAAWLFCAAVFCVVLLRAWAAPGWRACCRWPASCEGCGYSLHGVPSDGNCPECGKPIAESTLATKRTRGPARGGWLTLGDWFWCNGQAIVTPGRLGAQLMTLTPSRGRGTLIVITLLGAFAVCAVGTVGMQLISSLHEGWWPNWQEWIFVPMVAGSAVALITLMMTLAGAAVVGTSARLRTGRDLMPLAMDAAVSLGGFLVLAQATFWAAVLVVFVSTEVLDLFDTYGAPRTLFIGLSITGTPILLLVIYLILLGRIVLAGRYANT